MSTRELLLTTYQWADANAVAIAIASVVLPLVGAVSAWIGRGGKTDADGRFIASAVIGLGLVVVALEAAGAVVASSFFDKGLLDANILLVIAPPLFLAGSLVGVRWVFPLSELGSVRTAADIGVFLAGCAAVVWLLSTFRGWGVVFFGGLMQLVLIAALLGVVLWMLYRRVWR